jgi:hypothetical protein
MVIELSDTFRRSIYLCIHRHASFIFYLQAALAGVELGYFNTGYLCREFNQENSFNCIEQFLNMYLMIHGDNIHTDPYALLMVAEYYQWEKRNLTKAMQLYVQLYRNGDPQVRIISCEN